SGWRKFSARWSRSRSDPFFLRHGVPEAEGLPPRARSTLVGMAVLEVAERHQELVDELLETVESYKPDLDRDLIARAFSFAAKATEGQQRRSGEEFINHRFGVAKILAELRMDEQTIAAALLHDVVEDTDSDLKAVRDEFGDEIAQLVDGVTKLTRIQFQS